jgi:hypothetical protein
MVSFGGVEYEWGKLNLIHFWIRQFWSGRFWIQYQQQSHIIQCLVIKHGFPGDPSFSWMIFSAINLYLVLAVWELQSSHD